MRHAVSGLAQRDIWHVEVGHMRTRVIAHPSPPIPRSSRWDTYGALLSPVLRRVSSTKGEALRDRWQVALVAPGGRSRGRSTKTRFIFPIPM